MATTPDEDHGSTGGLSAAGRFARMEAALERIEHKLDGKADTILVGRLDERLGILEDHGSREARDALTLASSNQQRIIELEKGDLTSKVSRDAQTKIADARYRSLLIAVAVVTIAGVVFNAVIIVTRFGQ
jgi:uncharacterized membrane protein YcjF (UPF0283 family)